MPISVQSTRRSTQGHRVRISKTVGCGRSPQIPAGVMSINGISLQVRPLPYTQMGYLKSECSGSAARLRRWASRGCRLSPRPPCGPAARHGSAPGAVAGDRRAPSDPKGIYRLQLEARQLAERLGELRVGLLAEHDRAIVVGTGAKIAGQHLGAGVLDSARPGMGPEDRVFLFLLRDLAGPEGPFRAPPQVRAPSSEPRGSDLRAEPRPGRRL